MSKVPSTKPYLVRALYEWCVDSGFTPHVAVQVDDDVRVPRAFVRDGQIVLNVAPDATNQFNLDNEALSCQARFGGVAQLIYVPIANIAAIYARENGQGMAFEVELKADASSAGPEDVPTAEEPPEDSELAADEPPPPDGGARPRLRVIK
ncbi:ClpXP protease specificity-enhancing factor [Niveibacterium sp. 24ML]|uniref:ClpXP protease specificity-enhancing factor n=1 Tax=Niveibacterium sp. 24ML TaxID=2985512 RepID=UPI0022722907|nr:ClpXP protease specificity-enhancing factor [Niveibacterium sp. 24ML]MCX9154928.1 ClpXP protease specificity-enhancing factor [Niveibacterium sp. 24ML]